MNLSLVLLLDFDMTKLSLSQLILVEYKHWALHVDIFYKTLMQIPLSETHLSMLQIRCYVCLRVCVRARPWACVIVNSSLWAFSGVQCISVLNEDLCLRARIVVQVFRCVCLFVNALQFALQCDWQQPLIGLSPSAPELPLPLHKRGGGIHTAYWGCIFTINACMYAHMWHHEKNI